MDNNGSIRRQITFDLGENKLKQFYPRPRRGLSPRYHKKAWKDIQNFMEKNGFKHRQYSVYVSTKPMTDAEVIALTKGMVNKMPWLNKCLNEIDVTNVVEQHSLMATIATATAIIELEVEQEE